METPFNDFSSASTSVSAEASGGAVFHFRPHALLPQSYAIFKKSVADFTMVGEYMVLDRAEDPALSEKKIINLIGLMNGNAAVMDVDAGSGKRLYFQCITNGDDGLRQQIIFRERGMNGVTHENALLLLDGDILNVTN